MKAPLFHAFCAVPTTGVVWALLGFPSIVWWRFALILAVLFLLASVSAWAEARRW